MLRENSLFLLDTWRVVWETSFVVACIQQSCTAISQLLAECRLALSLFQQAQSLEAKPFMPQEQSIFKSGFS